MATADGSGSSGPDPHRQVADLLRGHRGRDAAITSAEIQERLDIDDSEAQPATREIIREVVQEFEIPIAAGPTGYYVIETQEELEDYLETLQERKAGIQHRKEIVEDAWESWHEGAPVATDGAGASAAQPDPDALGPPLDFDAKRNAESDSWARADPRRALIERVSAYAWRVTLPDGDDAHTAALALDSGDYVGWCDCPAYEYHDGPCAHLCTVRQADWTNRNLGQDIEDVHGQLVQVLDVRDEADYLADRADEARADGGECRW